jgi:hypothetical protein
MLRSRQHPAGCKRERARRLQRPAGAVLTLVKSESARMPSDQQISILFDIASDGGAGLASNKLPDLMDLVADGYVEAGDGSEFYKLTAKGQDLLSERGGGANES